MVLECECAFLECCSVMVSEVLHQRPDIPPSITSATNSIDVSAWGKPSAAFPSSTCDIETKFGPQAIVIDITLCGTW